jgi:UDPglucose 6-dehydrogenase
LTTGACLVFLGHRVVCADVDALKVARGPGRVACGGSLAGVRIGVLGLAFKTGTNDLCDSSALAVAVKGAEAVVLLTDWPVFRTFDRVRVAELMDGHVVDSRNHLDADALLRAGLLHSGVGRASLGVTQFS